MMIGSCYSSQCAPAFLQGSLQEPAQNKCYSVRTSLARGHCVSTRKDLVFISPKWGSVPASFVNFSKKWWLHQIPKQPSSSVLEGLACKLAEPAPLKTGSPGSTSWQSKSARQVNIALTPKHKHPPLSCFHTLKIHLETNMLSFLGWVILSLCQMMSVTSLRELLRPLAWLSMSHKELHKQPTAVLAYGYHHSAPQTS